MKKSDARMNALVDIEWAIEECYKKIEEIETKYPFPDDKYMKSAFEEIKIELGSIGCDINTSH